MQRHLLVLVSVMLIALLAACGDGAASSSGGNGTFSIAVSGAAELSLSPDNARALAGDASEEDMTAFNLWFGGENVGVVSVFFYGTAAPESNTYAIQPLDFTADGDLTGQVTAVVLVESGEERMNFVNAEGSITLENTDGVYSGSFEFSVSDPMNAEISADVSGTFSEVAAN